MRTLSATVLCTVLVAVANPVEAAEAKPLWVAVTTTALEPALGPLAEKRGQEGFETVVTTEPVEQALKALPRTASYILLVGDFEAGAQKQPWFVPAKTLKRYRWDREQAADFLSDAAWGDTDGDLFPDVPVGRIPARTKDEADAVIAKIIAYENREPTADDLRVPVWTGAPGYGPMIDGLAVAALTATVQQLMPAWAEPFVICGDASSPFCGWPADHPAEFDAALKRGGAMALMMGHGLPDSFLSMRTAKGDVSYTVQHVGQSLAKGRPAPPTVIFACYTGDFGGRSACLAEWLVGSDGGPVAVIAATAESHPLTNYYSGTALVESLGGQYERLGQLWLASQRAAAVANDPQAEMLLASVVGSIEAQIDTTRLRRDQPLLYAILGDPATLLKLPRALKASVETGGDRRRWKAEKPEGAVMLEAGLRAGVPAAAETAPQPEDARAAFRDANAAMEFTPLLGVAGDSWEGSVGKPGRLRLVASARGKLHVAVIDVDAAGK